MPRILLFIFVWLPILAAAKPLHIVVSVPPLQTFVEKIGGEHVTVQSLVRPGYSPATYDVTPQQIRELTEANLYIRTGVPFEHTWLPRIQAANPNMPILDIRNNLTLRNLETHTHDTHHHTPHNEKDPHVWTDPSLVKHIAQALQQQLSALNPAQAETYARNHARFINELEHLDQAIHAQLDGLKQRQFFVFHPAWGYFADAYGLQQVVIEHEGKQPGARALARLIQQAKQQKITVVFVQPQFDQRQAEQIAQAIGGQVIAIDPLATHYVENLRQVSRQLAQALQP